jgi:hypothetical protein
MMAHNSHRVLAPSHLIKRWLKLIEGKVFRCAQDFGSRLYAR